MAAGGRPNGGNMGTERQLTGLGRLWKVSDVAEYLQVSTSWVYKQAEAGLIPLRRLGANLRFVPEEIQAYANGDWTPRNTVGSVLGRSRR